MSQPGKPDLDLEVVAQRLRERDLAVSLLERRIPPRAKWKHAHDPEYESNYAEVAQAESQAEAIRSDTELMRTMQLEIQNLRMANRILQGMGRTAIGMARFVKLPSPLRLSNVVAGLRRAGLEASANRLESLANEVGKQCKVHGHLADPIVSRVGEEQVAFGCPGCSDPAIQAAYEAEPPGLLGEG